MAILIREDGTTEAVTLPTMENSSEASSVAHRWLDYVYGLLGCEMIEIIRPHPGLVLVIDEEGKVKQTPRPVNHAATSIWLGLAVAAGGGLVNDFIVGPALLCTPAEVGES